MYTVYSDHCLKHLPPTILHWYFHNRLLFTLLSFCSATKQKVVTHGLNLISWKYIVIRNFWQFVKAIIRPYLIFSVLLLCYLYKDEYCFAISTDFGIQMCIIAKHRKQLRIIWWKITFLLCTIILSRCQSILPTTLSRVDWSRNGRSSCHTWHNCKRLFCRLTSLLFTDERKTEINADYNLNNLRHNLLRTPLNRLSQCKSRKWFAGR